jgi:uncharacterized membrane protein
MRIAVLVAATITAGLMAGLFYAFSITVMPALRRSSAGIFVEVMQSINRVILNGWFFLCFMGTLVLTALAAVLYAISGPSAVLVPVIIALVLYAAQLIITFSLNVPLNNALDRATEPEPARLAFEETWVRWNHVRTLVCTGSFGSLCWALTQV